MKKYIILLCSLLLLLTTSVLKADIPITYTLMTEAPLQMPYYQSLATFVNAASQTGSPLPISALAIDIISPIDPNNGQSFSMPPVSDPAGSVFTDLIAKLNPNVRIYAYFDFSSGGGDEWVEWDTSPSQGGTATMGYQAAIDWVAKANQYIQQNLPAGTPQFSGVIFETQSSGNNLSDPETMKNYMISQGLSTQTLGEIAGPGNVVQNPSDLDQAYLELYNLVTHPLCPPGTPAGSCFGPSKNTEYIDATTVTPPAGINFSPDGFLNTVYTLADQTVDPVDALFTGTGEPSQYQNDNFNFLLQNIWGPANQIPFTSQGKTYVFSLENSDSSGSCITSLYNGSGQGPGVCGSIKAFGDNWTLAQFTTFVQDFVENSGYFTGGSSPVNIGIYDYNYLPLSWYNAVVQSAPPTLSH